MKQLVYGLLRIYSIYNYWEVISGYGRQRGSQKSETQASHTDIVGNDELYLASLSAALLRILKVQ